MTAGDEAGPMTGPPPGVHVLMCSGCWTAVNAADLEWWPRLPGSRALLRVGCASCVTSAQIGAAS